MADDLRLSAPAKVNLVLEITGVRPDGYHEIDTVLQTIELADEVRIVWGGEAGVTASGPFCDGVPLDETNLAWRAATELASRCGRTTDGLHIHLEKRISAAGGLGGGASDAAAVLKALGKRWDASPEAVLEAANAIGSDEAFFLVGGTARAQGRGERVTPLPALPPHAVVLFVPRGTIERKTARMFAALDRHPFDDGRVAAAFAGKPPASMSSADVHNSFETVAFDLFPALAGLWEDLERRIDEPVRLAGAGPTLFWIGPLDRGARIGTLADGADCTTIATRTSPP